MELTKRSMIRRKKLLNTRVGDLIVKRDMGNGTYFCVCEPLDRECGRSRTVLRVRLVSNDIDRCLFCANAGRRGKLRAPVAEPEPVKAEPKPQCTEFCIGRLIDGRWLIAHDSTCPKMMPSISWPRGSDVHINGARI